MPLDYRKPAPPSDDRRWKIVSGAMRRHGQQPHALIETLHAVQDAFGYLDPDALRFVAASLRMPLSEVFGVTTFYHHFKMRPPGEHTCVVCTGTACYIRGAPQLLDVGEREFGLGLGETTPDGKVSLLSARCLGACGLAPVAVFDGEVVGKVTPEVMRQRIGGWLSHVA